MMYYFGTDMHQAGHYFWEMEGMKMHKSKIYFRDIPFNPENMPVKHGDPVINGTVKYFHIEGFTIMAIAGSCIDRRPGCKSVFFTKEELTDEEMKKAVFKIPICADLIFKFPFTVKF